MDDFKEQAVAFGKHVADAVSIGIAAATVAKWLPAMAALLSIVWTAIRIYESRSAQRFIAWVRNPHN